jgi:hypothetical protein
MKEDKLKLIASGQKVESTFDEADIPPPLMIAESPIKLTKVELNSFQKNKNAVLSAAQAYHR